jgi:hypothetical protein
MTQMSSVIISTVKLLVEYSKLCMSIRLGNARYSAEPYVAARYVIDRLLDLSRVSWRVCITDQLAGHRRRHG